MRIIRKSTKKTVTDAKVIYDTTGRPCLVVIDNVQYDADAFKFVETKEQTKTKTTRESKEVTKSAKKDAKAKK